MTDQRSETTNGVGGRPGPETAAGQPEAAVDSSTSTISRRCSSRWSWSSICSSPGPPSATSAAAPAAVRGPKRMWRIWAMTNTTGSLAYWLVGRGGSPRRDRRPGLIRPLPA